MHVAEGARNLEPTLIGLHSSLLVTGKGQYLSDYSNPKVLPKNTDLSSHSFTQRSQINFGTMTTESTSDLAAASELTNTLSNPKTARPPKPKHLLHEAIQNDSTADISYAVRLDPSLLGYALVNAVRKGSVSLTEYLLTTEHAPLNILTPIDVGTEPSLELLKVVVAAGWDLNQRFNPEGCVMSRRLVELVCWDEDMIKWCLENGAQVSDGAEDGDSLGCPPLTEFFAGSSTVSSFKLIRANRARIGRKTLHMAANGAVTCGPAFKPERMAMVKYLVEEERLNVNRLDTDERLANHFGTPIAYAAKAKRGTAVIRYLLANGADPRVKDCRGYDALTHAESNSNAGVGRALRKFKVAGYGP